MSSPVVEDTKDETRPVFPREITDHIIDCLRRDPKALCNCALTCRAWLPRSRHNLFHTLSINSFAALEALASISRMPRILPHFNVVHELSLHSAPVHTSIPLPSQEDPHCSATRPHSSLAERKRKRPFVHLLPLLFPQVLQTAKVLKILFTDWSAFPSHPGTRFHRSMFPSLTKLDLTHCTFGSLNELFHLIYAFPSLSHLSLSFVTWPNQGSIGTACYTSQPVLQSLKLSRTHPKQTNVILEWMSIIDQESCSLRHLDLSELTFGPETLRRIALSIGWHLESLRIRRHVPRADCKLLLAACSSLLSLRISTHVRSITLMELAEHLLLLTSRRLRYLHVDVWTADVPSEEEDPSSWKQVDDVLVCEQFASLEAVIVEWCFDDPNDEFEISSREAADICRIILPKLHAKGIVMTRPCAQPIFRPGIWD